MGATSKVLCPFDPVSHFLVVSGFIPFVPPIFLEDILKMARGRGKGGLSHQAMGYLLSFLLPSHAISTPHPHLSPSPKASSTLRLVIIILPKPGSSVSQHLPPSKNTFPLNAIPSLRGISDNNIVSPLL